MSGLIEGFYAGVTVLVGFGLAILLSIVAAGLLTPASWAAEAEQLKVTVSLKVPAVARAGLASWYGEEYRGRLMANGGRFNPDLFICATWFWPLGTWLRVQRGSRSILVLVTDRGPALDLVEEGRIIDLSKAAFAALASTEIGLIEIEAREARGTP